MKRIFILTLFCSIFFFIGCSSKNETMQTSEIKQDTISKDEFDDEDAFLDEFEEEMQVEEKSDPFSGYNRVMTSFNDNLYEYVLSPVATGYKAVVHIEIRNSIGNFFNNIFYPMRLVNNILQGKIKNSGEETGRFLINTTVGILGLFDPATSYFNLKAHDEDLGQTLGYWGVGAGPHIVLPFFGPSNLRDSLSMYPNALINPIYYDDDRFYNLVDRYEKGYYVSGVNIINDTSLKLGQYEKLKEDAIDLYPYLRDVYEQYREQQIKE